MIFVSFVSFSARNSDENDKRMKKCQFCQEGGIKTVVTGAKLEEILTEIEKRQDFVSKELKTCPPGALLRIKEQDRIVYYHDVWIDGKRRRTSLNKHPEMLALLARKKYLEIESVILENNMNILRKIMTGFCDITPEQIWKQLPEKYKDLPKSIFFQDMEARTAECWQNQPYEQSDYLPDRKVHLTSRGLAVRSKSELIIAEKFYEFQVPFRYEQVLKIGKYTLAPDFTILTADDRMFYWEHCGLPENSSYMKKHKWKMDLYESAGIVPWKNLIVTYDNERGTIELPVIESEIRNKLL